MSNDHSFAVPKPVSDDTPDEYEVVLKGRFGSNGALYALVNHLREIGAVKQGRYNGRGDGSSEQTITLNLYELARSYATRQEKPFVDKSGEIYLMASLETNGRYKLGESIHPRQRLQEVVDSYGERFKIIAINYCSTDRFKRESWLKAELVRCGAIRLEREAFSMSDEIVEKFIALPND